MVLIKSISKEIDFILRQNLYQNQYNIEITNMAQNSTENLTDSLLTSNLNDIDEKRSKKISQATLIFTMMAASLGTGIFNLPLRVTEVGILPFIFYVILSASFSFYGAKFIQYLYEQFTFETYGQMSQSAFGKIFKTMSEIFLFLFPYGIAICYQVILVKFLIQLGADVIGFGFYENRNQQIYNSKGNWTRILLNTGVILTQLFFILRKELGIVQKLTRIGLIIIVYNTMSILILSFSGFTRNIQPNLQYKGITHLDWSKVQWIIINKGWQSFSEHVQALSSIIFCYVNHQLVFFTLKSMQQPSTKKFENTFKIVYLGQSIIYLIIGLLSYLLLLQHQDTEPIGPMVITMIPSLSMTIGKFLMVFTLYFCVPLNMFPAREIFYQGFNVKRTNRNHYILSIGLAISSYLIAIAFQRVNSYFGLLGGTAGVMMAGGIPALCVLKLLMLPELKQEKGEQKKYFNAKKFFILIVLGIVVLFAAIGAFLSVIAPT